MSRTHKTDPLRVQVDRMVNQNPYRYDVNDDNNNEFNNKVEYTVPFYAHEVREYEAFIKMLEDNFHKEVHKNSKFVHQNYDRSISYTTKEKDGYVISYDGLDDEMLRIFGHGRPASNSELFFSSMDGYDHELFGDIISKRKEFRSNLNGFPSNHASKRNLFNIVTVTVESIGTNENIYLSDTLEAYEIEKMVAKNDQYEHDFDTRVQKRDEKRILDEEMSTVDNWREHIIDTGAIPIVDKENNLNNDDKVVYTSESNDNDSH